MKNLILIVSLYRDGADDRRTPVMRVELDMGYPFHDPDQREMQDIAFGAKMTAAKVLRKRAKP